MADYGHIETQLAGLPADQRRIFVSIFKYLLKDIRFGRAIDGDASKNFGAGFFTGRTSATPNAEFTIDHTFGRTPYLLMPVLPLNVVNATIVDITVSKAADEARIYLKSSVADAPITVYVEG